ncbi:MAG: response regulator transcription factor [Acidibacillus sp.]|uniref:Response regulator protein VraR n=1 Tax=Sulfoacidibacillus ferrooxidans TaxID=2005001 RepID=A0A9X1V913_9BACL|nr:response regulator transcription factor [Sulfoacidibacillus ferrooxidans]MCI0183435.1 Response regulator protein VraR [Sulfoacidibacillus ferrooxidans]MCY0893552.1 response regulator transcription factor [Acidibacillus sp.]
MRIVIVDDHPLVRAGLIAVLSSVPEVTSVIEASTGAQALNAVIQESPDLMLVDLKLGAESGLDVIASCRPHATTCRYMILTSSISRHDFTRAMKLHVDGYALKEVLPEELLYAIKVVTRGRRYVDPLFLAWEEDSQPHLLEALTSKEREVLTQLSLGKSNRAIAESLYITEYTVKKHVSQILAKLHLEDRTQAALYAHSHDQS